MSKKDTSHGLAGFADANRLKAMWCSCSGVAGCTLPSPSWACQLNCSNVLRRLSSPSSLCRGDCGERGVCGEHGEDGGRRDRSARARGDSGGDRGDIDREWGERGREGGDIGREEGERSGERGREGGERGLEEGWEWDTEYGDEMRDERRDDAPERGEEEIERGEVGAEYVDANDPCMDGVADPRGEVGMDCGSGDGDRECWGDCLREQGREEAPEA